MNSRKDHRVMTIIVTSLVLAGCFLALPPSAVRAADVPPGAPTGLTATPGDGQVFLSWTAPVDGGDSVDHYVVYQDGVDIAHPTSTSFTATGLTNGQPYTFSVAAHNVSGYGPHSAEVTSTPIASTPAVPGAPTGLIATPGDGQVTLSWAAPASDGGAAIDHYVVHQDGVALSEHFTGTSATVAGLTNGQTYSFTVAAHNSIGDGPQSSAVQVTPAAASTAPGAPTGLQATAGDGQVTLTWAAPSSNGGSPITGYNVYRDGSLLTSVGNVLSFTDTAVTNEQTYRYRVSAVNAVGEGPQSNEASATPTASSTVPSAPLDLASTAGNGHVTLSWTAPTSDGGSSIDYYVVYQDGVDIAHPTDTSMMVSGLTNGQRYNFAVAAHNSVGEGPRSAAVTAVPGSGITVPGAPTGVTIIPGDGQVTISWNAPSNDGGAPIDYYIVYMNGVDVSHPTSTSVVISGLTNGVSYRFMIAAHNAAGISGLTYSKEATPKAGADMSWLPIGMVAVIGVAGMIVLFMMWRKRTVSLPDKPSPSRDHERQPDESVPETEKPEQIIATAPPVDRPVTEKEPEQSILCPRCGRPNSGRTKCQFCGKKLN